MHAVLVRQRPSIGDCLLLAPLVREIKSQHGATRVTVLTDETYIGGALPTVFRHMPGVDDVVCIPMRSWTTESNKRVDGSLRNVFGPKPDVLLKADRVYDCNAAFIEYEREHQGNPPLGIADFWLSHHGLFYEGVDSLPSYKVQEAETEEVRAWLKNSGKKILGIVLRAGDRVRNWDWGGRANTIAAWALSENIHPITIDPANVLNNTSVQACVGRRLSFVGALLQECDAVLTPDTGLLHMAQAVGTKTVSMWGKVHPSLRVKGYNTTVIPRIPIPQCDERERCVPCSWRFQHYSCIRKLSLVEIIDTTRAALQQ